MAMFLTDVSCRRAVLSGNLHSEPLFGAISGSLGRYVRPVATGLALLGAAVAADSLDLPQKAGEWLTVETADREVAKSRWYCGPDVSDEQCTAAHPKAVKERDCRRVANVARLFGLEELGRREAARCEQTPYQPPPPNSLLAPINRVYEKVQGWFVKQGRPAE